MNAKRNDFVDGAQIEPCLFCGRKAHQTRNIVKDQQSLRYWISCGARARCGATGPKRRTARGAIAAWNRAHDSALMKCSRDTDVDYEERLNDN